MIPYAVREVDQDSEWAIYITFRVSGTTIIRKYLWSDMENPITISKNHLYLAHPVISLYSSFEGIEDVIYTDLDGFLVLNDGESPSYASDL